MNGFSALFKFNLKRRAKDFFIISYNVIFPIILILLLGYLSSKFFSGTDGVTSYHYYTLVLVPMFIFMGFISVGYIAKDESLSKTSYRFMTAPIGAKGIILSKVLACTIVMSVCNIVVILLSKFVLGVDFMGKTSNVILIYSCETFMIVAIGIFVGLMCKNFQAIQGVGNIVITIFALLGGAFFPVGSLGDTFEIISYVSPLTWINKGVISMIHDNNYFLYNVSIYTTLIIGLIFVFLAVKCFKKEMLL